jgi:hypothetical protein
MEGVEIGQNYMKNNSAAVICFEAGFKNRNGIFYSSCKVSCYMICFASN